MSLRGRLLREGIDTDGSNVIVEGNIRASNLYNTRARIWYVHNSVGSDVAARGKLPTKPFASLDYAVGKCSASRGDIIYLLPGHAETVSTAAMINMDVAGVSVIGVGSGANKPTFTFSAVDATITMTAASCQLKNVLIVPSIDSVVSPIVVSAADCTIDVEVNDASSAIECVRAILTTAAADRLNVNLKYRGYLAGNACVNAIRLVGCDNARIDVDFFGKASTAIVEFHTTACSDIDITGYFYNGTTSLTKNVVDTVTGSTWSARGWDGVGSGGFSGGDNAASALDDVGAVATAIATIDAFHDVPTADTSTNSQMRDVIGNKDDAAAAGAVTTSESIMAYIKQAIGLAIARDTAIGVVDGYHDVPTADTSTNAVMRDVVGNKTDAAAAGTVSTAESLMAYVKQLVTCDSGMNKDRANYLTVTADMTSATWNSVASHEVLTVTGLVRVRIVPVVSTNIGSGGAAKVSLGTDGTAAAFIAATTATELDDGEIWQSSTAAENVPYIDYEAMVDQIVNGEDVGYTITTTATTAGNLIFHIWWEPLASGASASAGVGGSL